MLPHLSALEEVRSTLAASSRVILLLATESPQVLQPPVILPPLVMKVNNPSA